MSGNRQAHIFTIPYYDKSASITFTVDEYGNETPIVFNSAAPEQDDAVIEEIVEEVVEEEPTIEEPEE